MSRSDVRADGLVLLGQLCLVDVTACHVDGVRQAVNVTSRSAGQSVGVCVRAGKTTGDGGGDLSDCFV